MNLYIQRTAFVDEARNAVLAIAGASAHRVSFRVSQHYLGTPGELLEVWYDPTQYQEFAHFFLNDVANGLAEPVVIYAMGSEDPSPFTQRKMKAAGGETHLKFGHFWCLIDAELCGGKGRFACDQNKARIENYDLDSVLVHELSHARSWSKGEINSGTPEAMRERLAIADENSYRTARRRTPRHPTDYECGGCHGDPTGGDPESPAGSGYRGGIGKCLIVSAASGSPESVEVRRFQALRDAVLRGCSLGDAIVSEVLREYYTFSPALARRIEASSAMKDAVKGAVVDPLLGFFRCLEAVATDREFGRGFGDAFGALVRTVALADHHDVDRQRVLELAAVLDLIEADGEPTGMAVAWQHARTCLRSGPSVGWAIREPLELCWRCDRQVDEFGWRAARSWFEQAIVRWMSGTPIPPPARTMSRTAFAESLLVLSERVLATPELRRAVGRRLTEQLQDSADFDVKALLQAHGYAP